MSPVLRIAARIFVLSVLGVTASACSGGYSTVPSILAKPAASLYILDTAVIVGTDKTMADHVTSYKLGKDCSAVRAEQGRTYCREDEPNPIGNQHCYQTLGDVVCYSAADPNRNPDARIGNLQQSPL